MERPGLSETIDELRAENERLRAMLAASESLKAGYVQEVERLRDRNAALVEIVRDSPCPSDRNVTVANCQQCGCSHGLMIRDPEQKAPGNGA